MRKNMGELTDSGIWLFSWAPWLELLEEVVSLVIHKDEGWEVFHFNLPNSFHAEFGVFHTLNALDAAL